MFYQKQTDKMREIGTRVNTHMRPSNRTVRSYVSQLPTYLIFTMVSCQYNLFID